MKLIDTSPHAYKIHILRAAIEKEGIECVVNNEQLAQLSGELPLGDCFLELYVADKDADTAMAVYKQMRGDSPVCVALWQCSNCQEEIEDQYNLCWNCEHPRQD